MEQTMEVKEYFKNYTDFVDSVTAEVSKNDALFETRFKQLSMQLNGNYSRLDNAIAGLAGESGEVADLWKKIKYHDLAYDDETRQKLKKELGDVCYCKNCNVSLIDRRFYACEFYDEEKPRPALLCILSKFEDNSMLIHRGRSNHILPVLRKINDAFESGNGVCLRDILEDYAPDIIETMKQLEGEKK
jgi:hypothetical protein